MCFSSVVVAKIEQHSKIQAYFNNNSKQYYVDDYRQIERRGDNFEQIILDFIAQAKTSVQVAVQELRIPSIAHLLAEKQSQGVDVKVILENSYDNTILSYGQVNEDETEHESMRYQEFFTLVDINRNGEIEKSELSLRDAVYILKKNKIKVKNDSNEFSAGSGLMHHKFIIVDESKVLITSANFTLSDFHGDFSNLSTRGNANAMLVVDSKDMAKLFKEEFYLMWGGTSGRNVGLFGMNKPYRGRIEIDIDGTPVIVQFSPTSQKLHWSYSVNGLIAETLSEAKSEVLMSLFVFTDQNIANTLYANYLKNNLSIQGVFEPKFANRNYSETLDLWGIKLLSDYCEYESENKTWKYPLVDTVGVVNLPRGDMLHHKFGVVDQETVIFGSHNWSDAANNINDEFIIILKNKNIAQHFSQEFHRLNSNVRFGPSQTLLDKISEYEEACR